MPCFHPLKAFKIGTLPSGKDNLKICSYATDHVELIKGVYTPTHLPGRSGLCEKMFTEWKEIPCGQCEGCRIDRSRDWANRCMMELQYHKDAYFVTLTYNDEHVPRAYYADPETGEAFESKTLLKRDWQLFMKRLRKATSGRPDCENLRFFMCGEYGPKTLRPHYHAIIFGLHLDDLKPFSQRQLGKKVYNYFTSETLQNAWSVVQYSQGNPSSSGEVFTSDSFQQKRIRVPLGHVLVGQVTWETCAYVARYVLKKQYGVDAQVYTAFNLEPEFTLMSRRPGIGRQWYEDHPECYDFDFINISTPDGGKKIRPPKYFDRLFDLDNHEEMLELKSKRQQFAEEQKKAMMASSSLTYPEILEIKERMFHNRIKTLRRELL